MENDAVLFIKSSEYEIENEILDFTLTVKGLNKLLFISNNKKDNDIAVKSEKTFQSLNSDLRSFDKRILPGPTISALVYSIIMLGFAIGFYILARVPLFVFIISILLTTTLALSIIIDGRYIVVIPLPFISLFKTYDSKPLQLLKVRTCCLIITILSLVIFFTINIVFALIV